MDVRQPGTITLQLVREQRRMTMTLSRDGEGPSIQLEIFKEGSPPFLQRLQVANVSLTLK